MLTENFNDIGKIVCIGRNYVAHAKELGNVVPTKPLLFMKPASCIRHVSEGVSFPRDLGECHYECELVIQLNKDLSNATLDEVQNAIGKVTLGLDLTLRDVQSQLKEQGLPWERAKCFDGAAVLGDWVNVESEAFSDFRTGKNIRYQLFINDKLCQDGDTAMMLFDIPALLVEISRTFSLQKGDIIMTGTPAGVGKLNVGDKLVMSLQTPDGKKIWQTQVI